MINTVQDNRKYRNDIDGLRSIALLAVILFHFGHLSQGYLGVDIFFVLSGFLITRTIYTDISDSTFSIKAFYLRRIRRIVPLTLFVSLFSLIVGIATMLPDDLENLSQSVIATNVFANNILQLITTKNYWDVVNMYKPLMHTWYLGVQEQCYLLYPFLFILIGKKRILWLLPIISTLALTSLTLYLLPYYENYQKFYLVFFRFWEIGAGGIAAILLRNKRIDHKYSVLIVLMLVSMLCFNFSFISRELTLLITVLLTLGILASTNQSNKLSSFMLENKLLMAVGKISFSMYMWHQVLLAYARYFLVQEPSITDLLVILILTIMFSAASYLLIEKPFRNKHAISTHKLFITLGIILFLSSSSSLYLYLNSGILKDIPELGIKTSDAERNIHATYNSRVFDYDNPFRSLDKLKVLVIGDSFARDWVNVLLESPYATHLEISYVVNNNKFEDIISRSKEADIIFYSTFKPDDLRKTGIQEAKLWVVGTKNFGTSNGIFYNNKGEEYYKQRTRMESGYLEENNIMRQEWGNRYINYIAKVIDIDQTVPVFTPNNMFISQDCRHFTKAGAQYFSQLFENDLASIFTKIDKHRFSRGFCR